MPLTAGRLQAVTADRYRIVRELGSGGMATVFLAEDLEHHWLVAVKVLRPELTAGLAGSDGAGKTHSLITGCDRRAV